MFQNITHSLMEWDNLLNYKENEKGKLIWEKNKGEAALRLI